MNGFGFVGKQEYAFMSRVGQLDVVDMQTILVTAVICLRNSLM